MLSFDALIEDKIQGCIELLNEMSLDFNDDRFWLRHITAIAEDLKDILDDGVDQEVSCAFYSEVRAKVVRITTLIDAMMIYMNHSTLQLVKWRLVDVVNIAESYCDNS